MEYIRLGSAGLKVSRICLGMMSYGSQAERAWHLDQTAAEPIVKAAIDGGVTFFDTADTYSGGVTEQITGSLLGRLSSGARSGMPQHRVRQVGLLEPAHLRLAQRELNGGQWLP